VKQILPCWFRQSKVSSFQRQLNLYGFHRLTTGKDKGAYYHELFLRGMLNLSYFMKRTKIKGTRKRQPSKPEAEPNFYLMSFVPSVAPISVPTTSITPSSECSGNIHTGNSHVFSTLLRHQPTTDERAVAAMAFLQHGGGQKIDPASTAIIASTSSLVRGGVKMENATSSPHYPSSNPFLHTYLSYPADNNGDCINYLAKTT